MPAMKAFNKTQNRLIADNIKKASRPITRIMGLLTKASLNSSEGLVIVPCKQIHSCFMRTLFDAVFLDAEGHVIHLIEKMPAWQFSNYEKNSRMVLELAPGKIKEENIQLKDVITFEPAVKYSFVDILLGFSEFIIYIIVLTIVLVIALNLLMRLIGG